MRSNSMQLFSDSLFKRLIVELRHFVNGIVARIKRLNGQKLS